METLLFILLGSITISIILVQDMCNKRGISSGIWIFASLFVAWFAPIILGMFLRTVDTEARRQFMIEVEKEKLYKQREKEGLK